MRKAVCPGSFDPPTFGHLDIVSRAACLFDHVSVAVLVNDNKRSLFGVDERLDMLAAATRELDNVAVTSFHGLLIDFCTANDIAVIVKGLRANDIGYELSMAQMNRSVGAVETVFIPTSPEWSYLASSLVKEIARFGGDVSKLVPSYVVDRLRRQVAD